MDEDSQREILKRLPDLHPPFKDFSGLLNSHCSKSFPYEFPWTPNAPDFATTSSSTDQHPTRIITSVQERLKTFHTSSPPTCASQMRVETLELSAYSAHKPVEDQQEA